MQVTAERLKALQDSEFKLECLEAGGVDNWEGYSESLKDYFAQQEHEERVEAYMHTILEAVADYVEEPIGEGHERGSYMLGDDGVSLIEDIIRDLIKGNTGSTK